MIVSYTELVAMSEMVADDFCLVHYKSKHVRKKCQFEISIERDLVLGSLS